MGRHLLTINNAFDRNKARNWIDTAPAGARIMLMDPKRTLDQNARMWGCLAEISEQVEWYGDKLEPVDWKDVFTAALRKARVVPGIDRGTFVQLGMHSSELSKDEFSDLLELINAFAAEHDVRFSFEGAA
ncbi:MAG TPA: recombination protein NinB [Phyllobacterium sp.]|nr:recombination protein NinB [Phyllobacterium sp.]